MLRIKRSLNSSVNCDNCFPDTRELMKSVADALNAYGLNVQTDFEDVIFEDDMSSNDANNVHGKVTFKSNNSKLDNPVFEYPYDYKSGSNPGQTALGQKIASRLLHDMREVAGKKGY